MALRNCELLINMVNVTKLRCYAASQIPLYAGFKLWSSIISPLVLGRGRQSVPIEEAAAESTQATSKRQEKLKKRQERGDPRVQSRTVKKAA